jgi:hypothetical protein
MRKEHEKEKEHEGRKHDGLKASKHHGLKLHEHEDRMSKHKGHKGMKEHHGGKKY